MNYLSISNTCIYKHFEHIFFNLAAARNLSGAPIRAVRDAFL